MSESLDETLIHFPLPVKEELYVSLILECLANFKEATTDYEKETIQTLVETLLSDFKIREKSKLVSIKGKKNE